MANTESLKQQLTSERTLANKQALSAQVQQLAFETSLQQMKVKCPSYTLECGLWIACFSALPVRSHKSPAQHEVASSPNLPSRLNQILAGVPYEYWYNQIALETIKTFFKDLRDFKICVTLVLDEIKLRESIESN